MAANPKPQRRLGFFVAERWEDGGRLKGVMLKTGSCQLGLSQDDFAKGRDRRKGDGFRIWCDTAQLYGPRPRWVQDHHRAG
jgi:hypothetical protein